MQIMYVCTGNQCRSVMAEYYTRAKLADRGIGLQNDNITVRSAGTLHYPPHPADPMVIDLLKNDGIDANSHSSTPLTTDISRQADLILCFEREQISDCMVFFDTIATFVQTIAGGIIPAAKNMAQISNGISNPVVAGIVYWLIRILICGGCLVGAGILVAFIEIKIAELYKKCCWDMITIMVILISMATAIYFGNWIKTALPINLLFLLLFVQLVYVGIRWYVKGWREARGYY